MPQIETRNCRLEFRVTQEEKNKLLVLANANFATLTQQIVNMINEKYAQKEKFDKRKRKV